ncbi:MAG: hypothetical protein R3E68_19880 [Burkholderiaceae bacterium]
MGDCTCSTIAIASRPTAWPWRSMPRPDGPHRSGVLAHAARIVGDLPAPRQGELAPVVYVLSDGQETCDGDPVRAAGALHGAGVGTAVNTIGLDVDEKPAAQLAAIAQAGAGSYFSAKDAPALRQPLNAIKDAEAELARYAYRVSLNTGAIVAVYHDARIALSSCYQRNNPTSRQVAVIQATNRAKERNEPEAVCADGALERATSDVKPYRRWLQESAKPLTEKPLQLIEQYAESMKPAPTAANK